MTKKSQPPKAQAPKQNAAFQLEQMRSVIGTLSQNVQTLAGEIDKSNQIIRELARRLNATIQAGEIGAISMESVNQIIINENVKELAGKVSFLVEQGALVVSADGTVTEQSFIVGREVNAEGTVVNPRIQFAVNSIEQEIKSLFLNKKVGELVREEEKGISIELTEVYDIAQEVKKDVAVEAPTA